MGFGHYRRKFHSKPKIRLNQCPVWISCGPPEPLAFLINAFTMKSFPPSEFYSQKGAVKTAFALAFMVCVVVLHVPCLSAQTLKVRTQTVGRATQFLRTDRTVSAQRPLSQIVDVWGYDLTGKKTGALRGEFSFRYFNDFGLSGAQRANPYLAHEWNRLSIDLANISWRPWSALDFSVGRLITRSMFAARDFDGARIHLVVPFVDKTAWTSHGYVGRHVVGRPETFNPDSYDVQGRPIEDRVDETVEQELLTGFRTGFSMPAGVVNIGWERRETADAKLEEKLAVGANGNPLRTLNVVGYMSYHTILSDLDRARLLVAWSVFQDQPSVEPTPRSSSLVTSIGAEHVVPTFDSNSIFNLFGTSPSQAVFWSNDYRLGLSKIGLKTWLRLNQGDGENFDFGSDARDSRTVGVGVDYRTKFYIAQKPLTVSTLVSFQPAGSNAYGADQGLGRLSFQMPFFDHRISARTRSALVLVGADPSTRHEGGAALTQLVGVDVAASFGRLGLAAVGQTSDVLGNHLNLYASFSSELWP